MKRVSMVLLILTFVLIVGCQSKKIQEENSELVIYSPHTLEFIDPIIREFENETGITVEVISAGTGELLSRIENEENEPQGDVLWGGSLSSLESKKALFEVYYSKNESAAIYKNEEGYITRFSLVPSVIMVNTNLIGDIDINGYNDLLKEELKGRIAFANPAKSSSSYEQLLTQLWAYKEETFDEGWAYVSKLLTNMDGILLDSSKKVYTGVVEGEFFVGLTFEDAAAKYVQSGAPIRIVYPEEGTIVRPDGVSIIKNARHIDDAKMFVDFVTSYEIQHLIATELNRRSIRKDIEPATGLLAYDEMVIIQDNQEWSSENKSTIIEMFTEMYNKQKTESE